MDPYRKVPGTCPTGEELHALTDRDDEEAEFVEEENLPPALTTASLKPPLLERWRKGLRLS